MLTATCCGVASQRAAGLRRETIACNKFMYFRESKPKFLSPDSFSTMAEITPTTSLVVEIPETSENPTSYAR